MALRRLCIVLLFAPLYLSLLGSGGSRCTFFYASSGTDVRRESQLLISATATVTAAQRTTHQFPLHEPFGRGLVNYQDMTSNAFSPSVNSGFFVVYPNGHRDFVIIEENYLFDSSQASQLIDDIAMGKMRYDQRLLDAGYPIGNFILNESQALDVLLNTRILSLQYYDADSGDERTGLTFVSEQANRVIFTTPDTIESAIAREATHVLQLSGVIPFNASNASTAPTASSALMGVSYENLSFEQQANCTRFIVGLREGNHFTH